MAKLHVEQKVPSFLAAHKLLHNHCDIACMLLKVMYRAPSLHKIVSALCVCAYSVPSRNCYEIASLDKPFVTVFGVFYYTILVIKSPLHHNLCQAIVTKSVALSLLPCHDTSRVVTECV